MRKSIRISFIVATALSLLGFAIAFTTFAVSGFDVQILEREPLIEKTYTVEEAFTCIDLNIDTADVSILPASDGIARVVTEETETFPYKIAVKNGTLYIEDTAECLDFENLFAIKLRKPRVTVYLPDTRYGLLKIKATTGDVSVPEGFTFARAVIDGTTGDILFKANAEDVSIRMTTGDVTLSDMTCTDARIKVTTGDVELVRVLISEKLTVDAVTGDVELSESDAAEIEISVTTGDVEATLLTGKHFTVHTTTGDKHYPKNSTGGKCRITTTTGDIDVSVLN